MPPSRVAPFPALSAAAPSATVIGAAGDGPPGAPRPGALRPWYATGEDRWGWTVGGSHNADCVADDALRCGAGMASDAELAMAMQLEEMQAEAQAQAGGAASPGSAFPAVIEGWAEDGDSGDACGARLSDPVWGEVRIDGPAPLRRFLFFVCPCGFVCCGRAAGRRTWRRFLATWSVVLVVVQTVVLLVGIGACGGIVDPQDNVLLGPSPGILDTLGAKNAARVILEHEWWRLLTPMFVHSGFLHLLGNAIVQLRTGVLLEHLWGHAVWLVIYVGSGVYGALIGCATMPNRLSVGSSGALCGIIGAWLVFTIVTWNQTLPLDVAKRNEQVGAIGFCIVLIIAMSFVPLMDYAAHIGGLVAGAAWAMVLFGHLLQHEGYRLATWVVGFVLLACLYIVTLFAFLIFAEVDEWMLHIDTLSIPSCG